MPAAPTGGQIDTYPCVTAIGHEDQKLALAA
jgi:hypothetical protein